MSDPRQRVHFGIHADGASPDAAFEFGAPGGGEAEIVPGHGKATRRHELGQTIMRVSATHVSVASLDQLPILKHKRIPTVPQSEAQGGLKRVSVSLYFGFCLVLSRSPWISRLNFRNSGSSSRRVSSIVLIASGM